MTKENQFYKTYEETKAWLDTVRVQKYTIESTDEGLIVNVAQGVNLFRLGLTYLPVQFGVVKGYFWCNCNALSSLKGSPYNVDGNFHCQENKLTNLEYAPTEVGRSFDCNKNLLTSLIGSPKTVGEKFECSSNQLTSLEGAPAIIHQEFDCSDNKLTSLAHLPKEILGTLKIYSNEIDITYETIKTITAKNIIFTIPSMSFKEDFTVLKEYEKEGCITMDTEELKKILKVKNLFKKLDKDLNINTVKSPKFKL